MKVNETMHSILTDISEAIALLDSLSNEKSFTKSEWPRILEQDSSPSTAASWQTSLCFFQSSRMEDNRKEAEVKVQAFEKCKKGLEVKNHPECTGLKSLSVVIVIIQR